jgi:hypothetical protein
MYYAVLVGCEEALEMLSNNPHAKNPVMSQIPVSFNSYCTLQMY